MTDKSILFSLTSNNKIFDKIASRLDSLKILFKDDPEEIKPQPFGFTLASRKCRLAAPLSRR